MPKVAQARTCGKVEGKRGVGYKLLEEDTEEGEDAGVTGLEVVGDVKLEEGETRVSSSLRRLEFCTR